MVSDTPSAAPIKENALISKLLANGGATATVLWGYIGPSSREGFVTIHPSLRDLSVTIEIAERDIIYVADIPESIFPFDAKAVWIRSEASISHRLQETADSVRSHRVEGSAGAFSGADARPGMVDVTKGRLQMRVADWRQAAEDCKSPCSSTCYTPCGVCKSICKVKV
ncbi:hypothetical protein JQ582_42015 [Bradyrhizobium japonicum]|uniref:hypothetical protein n=1 Tax=Bradyrhizobium japonicum TaxID=375 RepID=UPI001BA61BE1|nr:hypothetical protein [Bradyrhizobium japonicum]MBR0734527.1 hypothetical protein [Bradyrhizobium japonicum]MBR0750475.1 hypothetical protein [Bradyrhizobium japonicum]